MSDTSPKDAAKAVAEVSSLFGQSVILRQTSYTLQKGDKLYGQEALSQVRKRALLEAEQVRLRLAEKYQNGIDTNTADMNGNCDWARLEGAVAVVQALRKLAEE